MNNSINNICLLGSSSGRNAGDAALISGIMNSIDAACGKNVLYEIPTLKPAFVRSSYPNRVKPVGIAPWNFSIKFFGPTTYRSIMRSDLSLIFDAILFDRSLYNPLFNYMYPLSLILPRAKKLQKRLGCFNITAGPAHSKAGSRILRDLLEMMDFVTVRDKGSLEVLSEIGVTNKRVALGADAALICPPAAEERAIEILRRSGFRDDEEILALNINKYLDTWVKPGKPSLGKEKFFEIYSAGVNKALKELNVSACFVCTQHSDVRITKELMLHISPPKTMGLVTNAEYSHYEVKAVFGKVSLLFGMRLHSQILCSSMTTPTVGLVFQSKVKHYYETLGLEWCALEFDNFTPDSVYNHIMSGWRERHNTRTHLQVKIPELQARARWSADIVAAIDRGEDIDRFF